MSPQSQQLTSVSVQSTSVKPSKDQFSILQDCIFLNSQILSPTLMSKIEKASAIKLLTTNCYNVSPAIMNSKGSLTLHWIALSHLPINIEKHIWFSKILGMEIFRFMLISWNLCNKKQKFLMIAIRLFIFSRTCKEFITKHELRVGKERNSLQFWKSQKRLHKYVPSSV